MRKKTALLLISLLVLTVLLTTQLYVRKARATPGTYYYKIRLSQRCCKAEITGTLENATHTLGAFSLFCNKTYNETIVQTASRATHISFTLNIDWDEDCVWDAWYPMGTLPIVVASEPIDDYLEYEVEGFEAAPLQERVLLEVIEFLEYHWRITFSQVDCDAEMVGNLTKDGVYIPGTDFHLKCNQEFVSTVVGTEEIPNDIKFDLLIDWDKDPITGPELQSQHLTVDFEALPWEWEATNASFPDKKVVVDLHDVDAPFHWKVTFAQKKCDAEIVGYLTHGGSQCSEEFRMNCTQDFVFSKVQTSLVPDDITFTLRVDWDKDPSTPNTDEQYHPNLPITTFPWQWEKGPHYPISPLLHIIIRNTTAVLEDPVCSYWEAISPFSKLFHLSSWHDCEILGKPGYGELSVCDQINLNETGLADLTRAKAYYHIEDMWWEGSTLFLELHQPMVVVDLHEVRPTLDPDTGDLHEDYRITLETRSNATGVLTGNLTQDCSKIPGTDFAVITNSTYLPRTYQGCATDDCGYFLPPGYNATNSAYINATFPLYLPIGDMNCTVVRVPWSMIPNDINLTLTVEFSDGYVFQITDEKFWLNPWNTAYAPPQFPWVYAVDRYGNPIEIDPGDPPEEFILIEVTEVEVAPTTTHNAIITSTQQYGPFPVVEWDGGATLPHSHWATNTYEEVDPITGISKFSTMPFTFEYIYSGSFFADLGTWQRMKLTMTQQAFGYTFTGEGKNPILGDVDIYTFANSTGTYFLGPDMTNHTADDVRVTGPYEFHNPEPHLWGNCTGPDGIPGTCDDPFGDGTPDPAGSAILFYSLLVELDLYFGTPPFPEWGPMVRIPFQIMLCTATANGSVIDSENPITGYGAQHEGHPYEFMASGCARPPDPKARVYAEYAAVWYTLDCPSYVGDCQLISCDYAYDHRMDHKLVGDIDDDWIVTWMDLSYLGASYGGVASGYPLWSMASAFAYLLGPYPNALKTSVYQSPWYNSRADLDGDGKVTWMDLSWLGVNYNKQIQTLLSVRFPTAAFGDPAWYVSSDGGQTWQSNRTNPEIHVGDLMYFNATYVGPGPDGRQYSFDDVGSSDPDGYIVQYTYLAYQATPNPPDYPYGNPTVSDGLPYGTKGSDISIIPKNITGFTTWTPPMAGGPPPVYQVGLPWDENIGFAEAGTYIVMLFVTDNDGLISKTAYVAGFPYTFLVLEVLP